MQFQKPLTEGILIKRYKRFLADIELQDGSIITAHTANTGAMIGCNTPGSRVWLSQSDNPKRKYAYSWELVEVNNRILVGINTGLPNKLVFEAIQANKFSEFNGYNTILTEKKYGSENSRIDLLLRDGKQADAYVEVKNVTMAEDGIGYFPDAVSTRGQKHLRELAAMADQGYRGILVFCVQRSDISEVQPADKIDPDYGQILRQVTALGVEVLALQAQVSVEEIVLNKTISVNLS